jgi:hypothetical protein
MKSRTSVQSPPAEVKHRLGDALQAALVSPWVTPHGAWHVQAAEGEEAWNDWPPLREQPVDKDFGERSRGWHAVGVRPVQTA